MAERFTASSITDDALDELYARLETAEAAVGRAERFAAELSRRRAPIAASHAGRQLRARLRAERGAPIQGSGYTPAELLGATADPSDAPAA